MDVGLIDPALLEEATKNDSLGSTTNGATASSSTATSPRPPPAPRPRTFSKANIDTWLASSYAPRRDANESRADYEQRLTLVTRKAPLSEACSKLSIKVPKMRPLRDFATSSPSTGSHKLPAAQTPRPGSYHICAVSPASRRCPQFLSPSRAVVLCAAPRNPAHGVLHCPRRIPWNRSIISHGYLYRRIRTLSVDTAHHRRLRLSTWRR
ncbi:hypothetical protein B0H14DRAFT_3123819 [Mycena olivaceomarginata]|nr:hypothetical protein B0H14DRAFT_3123819 [Mycena olivaceomarginata]